MRVSRARTGIAPGLTNRSTRSTLSDELWGEVFEPLRDPDYFRRVRLNPETGTVEWPNGADLAPTFLREKGTATPG